MIQQSIQTLLQKVACRVAKNHLFEQPGERVPQQPIFQLSTSKSVRLMSSAEIEEQMLSMASTKVVNHWATWCSSCVDELDILASIQSHIGAEKMLCISWDLFQTQDVEEGLEEVEKVAHSVGLECMQSVVTDEPDSFFQHFGLEEQLVPQTFVYSDTFEVLYYRVGVLTEEDIATIVNLVKGESR